MYAQRKILYKAEKYSSLFFDYHFHLHYEILYVSEGSVTIDTGGRFLKLSPCQLCIIPSMVPHKTVYANASVVRIIFSSSYISDHLSQEAIKTFSESFETSITLSGDSENPEIINSICQNIDEGGRSAYIYLYKLFRQCTSFWGDLPKTKNVHMINILSYIGKNSKKKLSLEEIAAACSITKFHICRLVKKEMGITPVDYITFAKMRRAVTKLLKTKNTVAQISCDLSFSSPKYFTRIFKECFGVSPQKFRCGEISEKEMYYLKKGVTK